MKLSILIHVYKRVNKKQRQVTILHLVKKIF
jgi:hypothetical protein